MNTIKKKLTFALISSGFAMQPAQGDILPYRPETLVEVPLVPYAKARVQAIYAGGIGMLGLALFEHWCKNLSKELFPDRPLLQGAAYVGATVAGRWLLMPIIFQKIQNLGLLGNARWNKIREALPGTEELELAPYVAADEQIQAEALKEMRGINSEISKLLMAKLRVAWDIKALHSLPMQIVDIVHSSQTYALMFITFATSYGLFNERPAIAMDEAGTIFHVRRHSPDKIKRRAKITYFAVWGGLALAAIGAHLRNERRKSVG